jgi:diaminopimelate decarboxylase
VGQFALPGGFVGEIGCDRPLEEEAGRAIALNAGFLAAKVSDTRELLKGSSSP